MSLERWFSAIFVVPKQAKISYLSTFHYIYKNIQHFSFVEGCFVKQTCLAGQTNCVTLTFLHQKYFNSLILVCKIFYTLYEMTCSSGKIGMRVVGKRASLGHRNGYLMLRIPYWLSKDGNPWHTIIWSSFIIFYFALQ